MPPRVPSDTARVRALLFARRARNPSSTFMTAWKASRERSSSSPIICRRAARPCPAPPAADPRLSLAREGSPSAGSSPRLVGRERSRRSTMRGQPATPAVLESQLDQDVGDLHAAPSARADATTGSGARQGRAAAHPEAPAATLAGARRGGRAVECGGLENRYPSLGGSRVQIPPPPLRSHRTRVQAMGVWRGSVNGVAGNLPHGAN